MVVELYSLRRVRTMYIHIYNHERVCTMYIRNFKFISMYIRTTYIYIFMYMYIHVHVVMYLYVHGVNMSIPCSDTYVPASPILSRWVGFQMLHTIISVIT